jgi:uncharacterized integral membrane protein (TIGR00697 family)
MGIPLSISIYYFPFVYILADILTEVYGYAIARRVLWYCIFAQLLAIVIFEFVIFYPPSAAMKDNQSYVDVLSAAPRLVLFGTLAMFAGDIANNYVLAKMKVWTNGSYISARFVTSTLCGQMVNTAVFYIFGLWGMIPTRVLPLESAEKNATPKDAEEAWVIVLDIRRRYWNPDIPDPFNRAVARLSERVRQAARASGVFRDFDSVEALHNWAKKRFVESFAAYGDLERDGFLLPDGEIKNLLSGFAQTKMLPAPVEDWSECRERGEKYRSQLATQGVPIYRRKNGCVLPIN